MNKSKVLLCAGTSVLVGFGSLACETSQTNHTSPGALPSTTGNVQPRVDASTYFAHGHLLERQGHLSRSVEQYERALQINPGFLAARNRLGITLNKMGRHAEATHAFQVAAKQAPDQAHVFNNLGFSLYLQEQFAEASAALEQALSLKPDFARARMNYALALGKLGRTDEAFAQFEQVGPPADAHYNLAILQTDAGDYVAAVESLDQALTLDPNFEAARQQLKVVARLAAEAETAEPTYESGPVTEEANAEAELAASEAETSEAETAVADPFAASGVFGLNASTILDNASFDLTELVQQSNAWLGAVMTGETPQFTDQKIPTAFFGPMPPQADTFSATEPPADTSDSDAVSMVLDQALHSSTEWETMLQQCADMLPPEFEELLTNR